MGCVRSSGPNIPAISAGLRGRRESSGSPPLRFSGFLPPRCLLMAWEKPRRSMRAGSARGEHAGHRYWRWTGIDYDGSKSCDSDISVGYGLEEYAAAVVHAVQCVCDRRP
ncbi:Arginine decarboxylase [Spatholobus suberectus]|nr:Arginine decarboxylase [Spatholobus suberectus]